MNGNIAENRLAQLTKEIGVLEKGITCFDLDDPIRDDIRKSLKCKMEERDQLVNRLAFRSDL